MFFRISVASVPCESAYTGQVYQEMFASVRDHVGALHAHSLSVEGPERPSSLALHEFRKFRRRGRLLRRSRSGSLISKIHAEEIGYTVQTQDMPTEFAQSAQQGPHK